MQFLNTMSDGVSNQSPCRSVSSKALSANWSVALRNPKSVQPLNSPSFTENLQPLKPLSFEFTKRQRSQSFVILKRLKTHSFTVTSYQRPPGNDR